MNTDTPIDLGTAKFDRGLFLVREKPEKGKEFPDTTASDGARFLHTTSHGGEATLKRELLAMIRGAKRKIFIASFRFGDPEILEALYAAADRLQGGVYIITALDESGLRRGLRELHEPTGFGSPAAGKSRNNLQKNWSEEVLNKQFDSMTRRGIYLRGHSQCHAKFAVVDDELAMVTSANFEPRAFTVTGECGILISDATEVMQTARFFTRLWHEGCDWEVAPGETYVVRKREAVPSPCSVEVPYPLPEGSRCRVIWTDGPGQAHILRSIHEVIEAAEEDLCLSTFGLCDLGSSPDLLFAPLKAALQRRPGLRVRLYLRGRNHIANHRADTEALHDLGVEILADSLNHAKGVIADHGRIAALFSANFDARHGLTSGVEAGVLFHGHPAGIAAGLWFDFAIARSDLEYQRRPAAHDVSKRLAVGWRKDWPWPKELRISPDKTETWRSLHNAAATGPALFEIMKGKAENGVRLFAGRNIFVLQPDSVSANLAHLTEGAMSDSSAEERFEQWLNQRADDRSRGVACGMLQHSD